jgi:acyl dehydratase
MESIGEVSAGSEISPLARTVTREDVKAYADASGDRNPLHQDDAVAVAAGFPAIIAHGMFTMGHLAACVDRWTGDPAAVVRLSAKFRSPVFMGDEIVAGGRVRALAPDGRSAILELWVTVERDGVTEYPITRGEAEVRLGPSAAGAQSTS